MFNTSMSCDLNTKFMFYAYIAQICCKDIEKPLEVWFSVDIIEL